MEKIRNQNELSADILRGKLTPILLSILQNSSSESLKIWIQEWENGNLGKDSHDQILALGKTIKADEQARLQINEHYESAKNFAINNHLEKMPSLQLLFKLMADA